MTRLVSPNLVHPKIYEHNIRQGQTKKCYSFLEHALFRPALRRVKSLSIDEIDSLDMLQPHTLSASLPCQRGIKYWKPSAKDTIEQRALPRTLRTEDGDVEVSLWELTQLLAA